MNVLGPPTQAGYLNFLRNIAGIPVSALPDDSFAITVSYNVALDIVSDWLRGMPGCNPQIGGGNIYTLCVYNLATDRLLYFAPDTPPSTYFADLRGKNGLNLNAFIAGVISESHDESTGQTIAVPESLREGLTLLDIQNMRTPFGRAYLAYAQMIGPGLWGLTG